MSAGRNNKLLALSKPQDKVINYLRADGNIQAFRNQLRRYNLKLRNIIGDGNCLFRSCKLVFVEFFFYLPIFDFFSFKLLIKWMAIKIRILIIENKFVILYK
jgi:hypothetical protein